MQRILVTYASKHGSTQEIAEAIAGTLREAGLQVDCQRAQDARYLGGYDGVILGSAVYMKRWRREARHFLHAHATELRERSFWVFSSGPVGDPGKDAPNADEWSEPKHTIETALEIGARDHAVFGGSIDPDAKGFPASAMVKNTPPEFLDRRNWDEIRAWATGVANELAAQERTEIS